MEVIAGLVGSFRACSVNIPVPALSGIVLLMEVIAGLFGSVPACTVVV